VRLARGGIREYEASLGHEMRVLAGTGRGGVSVAGGRQDQGAGKWEGVSSRRLPLPPCFFFRIYSCVLAFCLHKGDC